MSYTLETLRTDCAEPLAAWLIHAALDRSDLTYGEGKDRLEHLLEIGKIFTTHMGSVADEVMIKLREVDPNIPLLNTLLVQQQDRLPGDGIRGYFHKHSGNTKFLKGDVRRCHPKLWKRQSAAAAAEVYAFDEWSSVFEKAFDKTLPPLSDSFTTHTAVAGTEKDGKQFGGGGEGKAHKTLRLWVRDNPDKVMPNLKVLRTETEVLLPSGDRVDVVYYATNITIAIEVKSALSNAFDYRRGVFQGVKYRAVMKAMQLGRALPVRSILLTECDLDGVISDLARSLEISTKLILPEHRED